MKKKIIKPIINTSEKHKNKSKSSEIFLNNNNNNKTFILDEALTEEEKEIVNEIISKDRPQTTYNFRSNHLGISGKKTPNSSFIDINNIKKSAIFRKKENNEIFDEDIIISARNENDVFETDGPENIIKIDDIKENLIGEVTILDIKEQTWNFCHNISNLEPQIDSKKSIESCYILEEKSSIVHKKVSEGKKRLLNIVQSCSGLKNNINFQFQKDSNLNKSISGMQFKKFLVDNNLNIPEPFKDIIILNETPKKSRRKLFV